MATELELKARVDDAERVKRFLNEHATFKRTFFKKDIYYAPKNDDAPTRITRLRFEHGARSFTVKRREIVNGVEINEEREKAFGKNEARVIVRFLETVLGYEEYVRKEKKGRAYRYNGVTVELSSVKGLGDFVELEALDSGLPKEEQIALVYALLAELGIPKDRVEPAPYITLLRNAELRSLSL